MVTLLSRWWFAGSVVAISILVALDAKSQAQIDDENYSTAIAPVWLCEGRAPTPNLPEIGEATCMQYIAGMTDMDAIGAVAGRGRFICFPEQGVTTDQSRRIYLEWANRNPDDLHGSRRVALLLALSEAFPCE